MYMRLAFSVAAHLESDILVVDEVLAVGDAGFQKKCLDKMSDVAKHGRTVLFVSHNINAVERLCSNALLMQKGRIGASGLDVQGIIRQYLYEPGETEASEWFNTGDELNTPWFMPIRFFISDNRGGKCQMPVSNDADLWIQIEAQIEQHDSGLEVGYCVYSEEGKLLYWSFHTDQAVEKWPDVKAGYCIFRTKLPKRLLNEGIYRIELLAALHCRHWILQSSANAPSIILTITGGLSDSPQWMEKRPGILAPVLDWEVQTLSGTDGIR
jgi:lipopolysaccharide transport system ATP-binding protein